MNTLLYTHTHTHAPWHDGMRMTMYDVPYGTVIEGFVFLRDFHFFLFFIESLVGALLAGG